jgi:accessory gene regulator B
MAVAMGKPIEGIILLLTFMTLRKYTGGFHLGSVLNCYIVTALLYGISLYVSTGYRFSKGTCMVTVLISCVIIASYAPIDNPNLNLDVDEIKAMKIQARRVMTIYLTVLLILMLCGYGVRYIAPMVMGIGLDALFIVVGIVQRKRGDKDAEGRKKRLEVN